MLTAPNGVKLTAAITHEIEAALDRQRLRARRLFLVSPPTVRKRGRCVYRVDLADGRTVKARRLESADAARRLFALRAGLEPAFAPAIACEGAVLIERWIAGALLVDAGDRAEANPEAASAERVAEAGALLGRLHARAPTPAPVATRPWRERATAALATLAAAGRLAPADVARLATELARTDPEAATTGLAHQDFCAENMLVDARGRLRVIDNEWVAIAPLGLDLGRTFARWPMAPTAWRTFLVAYRAAARVDPGPLAFWKIAAALTSACIRLQQDPARLATPLAVLRRGAADPRALDDPA